MLQIRFLQTGGWNLGSPVAGLPNSPEWLRQTAASAVRRAVQNVFQTAVSQGCSFVLAAGRVASRQNLPAAVAWLEPRLCHWRTQGVRLVVAGHDADEWPLLQSVGAIVLRPNCGLTVLAGGHDLVCTPAPQSGSLWVDSSGRPAVPLASQDILYCAAMSATAPDASAGLLLGSGETTVSQKQMRLTTGSPQAVAANEPGAGCCALVTADFARGELTAQGYSPDVLQFVSAREECVSGTTLPQLLKRLADRHRALSSGRVVRLVDWEIAGRLRFSVQDDASLRESDVLDVLRRWSNAGHSGSWPYRLRFSEDCVIEVCERSSRLMAGILSAAASRGFVPGSGSSCLELLHQLQRAA
jgi:hypothetical protein